MFGSSRIIALAIVEIAQLAKRLGNASPVAQLLIDFQALPVEAQGLGVVPLGLLDDCHVVDGLGDAGPIAQLLSHLTA